MVGSERHVKGSTKFLVLPFFMISHSAIKIKRIKFKKERQDDRQLCGLPVKWAPSPHPRTAPPCATVGSLFSTYGNSVGLFRVLASTISKSSRTYL